LDFGLVRAQSRNRHPATDAMGGALPRTDRDVHNQGTKAPSGELRQGNIPLSDSGAGLVLPLLPPLPSVGVWFGKLGRPTSDTLGHAWTRLVRLNFSLSGV